MSNDQHLTLTIDRAKFRALKRAYHEAVRDGKTEFEFEGHAFLVDYAKYLLVYLASKFGDTP